MKTKIMVFVYTCEFIIALMPLLMHMVRTPNRNAHTASAFVLGTAIDSIKPYLQQTGETQSNGSNNK